MADQAQLLLLLVAAAVIIGALVYLGSMSKRDAIDLAPATNTGSGEPSIYQLISKQLAENPDGPLDYSKIDEAGAGKSVQFAPGLSDALFGGGEADPKQWKRVRKAIRAINDGSVKDWHVLERNILGINASANVDALLQDLLVADVTPLTKRLFWDVAKGSRNHEAIKWGVAIGSINLTKAELEPLLTLARHSEFTLYCAHALLREAENNPAYKQRLLELLPVSQQWGVIRLIDYIVADPTLVERNDVQRKILIYGMRNNEGIPMEVAFTIASAIELSGFIKTAESDPDVYVAVSDLMDTLLTEPAPLGGLAELPDWEAIYSQYVSMLVSRDPADIRALGGLRSLATFLADHDLAWSKRAAEAKRIEKIATEKFSVSVLERGLTDDATRWLSLQIIREKQVKELLPQVRELFREKPDHSNIETLGTIGEEGDIEAMLLGIPSLVDREARNAIPRSSENVFGPEHKHNMEYAQVVKYLGKLHTPASIAQIKQASRDYDPLVRDAAYEAIRQLPKSLVDKELRELVRSGVDDAPEYVAESARDCAKHHAIKVGDE